MFNNEDLDASALGYRPGAKEFVHVRLYNCKYDVCLLRGLSALSGEQFPPTLCGRVGEAAPHY